MDNINNIQNTMGFDERMSETESEIDLTKVIELLRQNIVMIISVMIIFGGAAFIVSQTVLTPMYTAEVMLYVKNNRTTNYTSNTVNDLNASQMLVDNFRLLLAEDLVTDAVGKKLEEKYGLDELAKMLGVTVTADGTKQVSSAAIAGSLSMNSVDETEILKIACTTVSPELSSDICNYLVDVAPQSMSEIMGISYVSPIGYARVPEKKTSPNTAKNTAVGAVVGLALACGYVFARYYLFNRELDSETLKSRFGVSVLGEIPVFSLDEA